MRPTFQMYATSTKIVFPSVSSFSIREKCSNFVVTFSLRLRWLDNNDGFLIHSQSRSTNQKKNTNQLILEESGASEIQMLIADTKKLLLQILFT